LILGGQQAAELERAYLHQSIIAYAWKEYNPVTSTTHEPIRFWKVTFWL